MLTVQLPPGPCVLAATERGLYQVCFAWSTPATQAAHALVPDAAQPSRAILEEARRQLLAYFAGQLREFSVPLDLSAATPFQRRVLEACARIGYGEQMSYGELARRAGHPGAARAVGQVMATNPLAVVVPCHRVVGSDGRLTGYGGGLALKAALLALERDGGGWNASGNGAESRTG